MVNFKKFGVAAAMALTAFSAMGSNFRAADQVYVPAAGHTAGASGTFISDVFVSNLTNGPVTVSVIFAAGANPAIDSSGNVGIGFPNLFTLAAFERREFVDFVASPSGLNLSGNQFGQLIFNGCQQNQDCGKATQDANGVSPFFANISVESRIYSIPPGATLTQNPPPQTLGQDFPGFPWYSFISSDQTANSLDKIFITGFRNNGSGGTAGTYRGNLGLVNASQYSTTTFVVKLFNGATNTQIGSDFNTTLGPLGQTQVNIGGAFAAFVGTTATNAYVTVSQTNSQPNSFAPTTCLPNGCPAFFAYGSVLDNASGDATTLEPQYLVALPDAAQAALYPGSSGKSSIRRAVHH